MNLYIRNFKLRKVSETFFSISAFLKILVSHKISDIMNSNGGILIIPIYGISSYGISQFE